VDISAWILLIAVLVAGCVIGVFVILLIGIRAEEHHMSLRGAPYTRTEAATRRVLSVGVRNPHPGYCPCPRHDETPGPHRNARK